MTNRYIYVPDLIADMAECDVNYIRLCRLFPDMDVEDELRFGVKTENQDSASVTIRVRERCRFTTMLTIDVDSANDRPFIKWPSLEIRMYHDVKSAEVIRFERHRNFRFRYPTPNANMFQPDEKSQINRFLGELLTHCIENGHSLRPLAFT
ncbi:MAG: DUF1249 domain-containing protein [Proteobacteria bacterium]|nr:DUF1249 domain-containing protein [Pseudomonadota bacterium]